MVLPEYQWRGLAKAAVLLVLQRERVERRWGLIHALTSTANVASNALCRSLPFALLRQESYSFDGRDYTVNHWTANALQMRPTQASWWPSRHEGCS